MKSRKDYKDTVSYLDEVIKQHDMWSRYGFVIRNDEYLHYLVCWGDRQNIQGIELEFKVNNI